MQDDAKKNKDVGKQRDFSSVGDILKDFQIEEDKYISREFQKYGYDLAKELGDLKNKSLYIKLAKETPRGFLETARSFVKDANNVKSPGKLFMWKLQELKKEKKAKMIDKEETNVGAHAILVCEDDGIVLQQREDRPELINPGLISMFGGTINKDEDVKQGLTRELSEELGIDINDYEVKKLDTYYKSKEVDGMDYTIHVFVISDVDLSKLKVTEGIAVKKSAKEFLDSAKLTRITRLAVQDYIE